MSTTLRSCERYTTLFIFSYTASVPTVFRGDIIVVDFDTVALIWQNFSPVDGVNEAQASIVRDEHVTRLNHCTTPHRFR